LAIDEKQSCISIEKSWGWGDGEWKLILRVADNHAEIENIFGYILYDETIRRHRQFRFNDMIKSKFK